MKNVLDVSAVGKCAASPTPGTPELLELPEVVVGAAGTPEVGAAGSPELPDLPEVVVGATGTPELPQLPEIVVGPENGGMSAVVVGVVGAVGAVAGLVIGAAGTSELPETPELPNASKHSASIRAVESLSLIHI